MLKGENIEESDSDDSDFNIPLGYITSESSGSDSDRKTSEIDRILTSSQKKKKKSNKVKIEYFSKKNERLPADFTEHKNNIDKDLDQEKQRTDFLWNNFLNNTGEPSKNDQANAPEKTDDQLLEKIIQKKNDHVETDKELQSCITKTSKLEQLAKNVHKNIGKPKMSTPQDDGKKRGLSNILNTIAKKSKLSTLEKSKQDWNHFKEEHNLNEEITNFNRGKNGYLERQDFLQRTDSRQFEIERSLRNSGRKKMK